MEAFWIILGIVILLTGLLDLFLTVLDYDESGFLTRHLWALVWRGLRGTVSLAPNRWRQFLLRQSTGLQIVIGSTFWVGCVIAGFGFIYTGLMYGDHFTYDGGKAGVFYGLYLSAVDLATVGTGLVSPASDLALILTALEELSTAMLITLILGFLLSAFQVIRTMRTLCATLGASESDAGDPIASLAPYFPAGQPTGLDSHLQNLSDGLWSYTDGLRTAHIAYYAQSGRQNYSLPYLLHMLSGIIGALRWGLPGDYSATHDPSLVRLTDQLEQFANYMQPRLGWDEADAPEPVTLADFRAAESDDTATADKWVQRFFQLSREMGQLARINTLADIQDAHTRYQCWLPFAYHTEKFTKTVGHYLDYQPDFS